VPREQLACPRCANDTQSAIVGHKMEGAYDGILVWGCMECGHMWHRYPEGHPLRVDAERWVANHPWA
jgi:uncharacterized Zn finger protein